MPRREGVSAKLIPSKLLSPISHIPIILGIGLNYALHAKELNTSTPPHPILFTKPPTAVQNPFAPICVPKIAANAEVDYEAELAVVIGKKCKDVKREEALEYVLGYTCANDVTARVWQRKIGQWSFSKSVGDWAYGFASFNFDVERSLTNPSRTVRYILPIRSHARLPFHNP